MDNYIRKLVLPDCMKNGIMENPTIFLLFSFLNKIGVRVESFSIQEIYARHPLPHSLRSISDTLDELGVENAVYRLEFEQLFEIEGTFIVVAGKDEYPFHIVERLDRTSETVTLLTAAGRRVMLSFEQFRAVWDGTVLMAEKGERTQEDNRVVYWLKQGFAFFDRTALYWLTGLAVYFVIWAAVQSPALGDLRYLAKTAGVVVSLLVIVKTSLDPQRFQRFCRYGTHADCNEVLHSAGAKLLGWASLGELSFAYFSASILWGVFFAENPAGVFPVLDILAIFVICYSLTWQIYHEKWCTLCLLIDLVLITDLFTSLFFWDGLWRMEEVRFYPDLVNFGLMFGLCLLATKQLVGIAEQNRKIPHLKFRIERLLSVPDLFWQQLYKQPEECVDSNDIPAVCNFVEAEHTITVVMNPSCPKCGEAHRALASLEGYRINLVFIVNEGDERSRHAALVMTTAGMKYGWKDVDEVIRNWYEKQELPLYLDVHHYAKGDLEQQIKYCRQIGVEGTPTVLVDNRRLPELYDIEDLKVLL